MNNFKKQSPSKFFSSKFIFQECLNPELVLEETDTFEEYPVIYRLQQIENWQIASSSVNILPIWINYAVFLLNNYVLINNSLGGNSFLCLSFTDFHEEHPPIPKIFTSTKLKKDEFISKLISNSVSNEMEIVKSGFFATNLSLNFNFYESRFIDHESKSDIIRIFCIHK